MKGILESVVYTGHNHRTIDRRIHSSDGHELRLLCFKAVGQARDHDPVAGYAIEEDGVISHHSVEFDVEAVIRDIEAIPLPEPFRNRWVNFVRTGYDPLWSRPYPN